MKKVYMQPSVEAYNVKNIDMVCASLGVNSDATEGSGGWGSAQGKRGGRGQSFDIFDDEEDY